MKCNRFHLCYSYFLLKLHASSFSYESYKQDGKEAEKLRIFCVKIDIFNPILIIKIKVPKTKKNVVYFLKFSVQS